VLVRGSLIYVADWGCALQAYEGPVGIEEAPDRGDLRRPLLHPNPARTRVMLEPGGRGQGTAAVLYDSSGRRRRQTQARHGRLELDLVGLEAGVYLVRLDASGLTSKLVVQP
jgi:hypothetical protein